VKAPQRLAPFLLLIALSSAFAEAQEKQPSIEPN
jgi:hypothetical protein